MRLIGLLILILCINACTMKKVDLIVQNATIYTVDEAFTLAEAMAVSEGKIIAVGSNEEIGKHYVADERVDANGKFIYPGLKDAHCHFWGYASSLSAVNLNGTSSFEEVMGRVEAHLEKYPSEWLSGRGWDQNDWEIKEFPNKQELDERFPDKAIVLTRVDGHAVLASSKAIELSKISEANFQEGMIQKKDDNLTGIFLEAAGDWLKNAVPKPSVEKMKRLLQQAEANCFAVGLTSVYDAGMDVEQFELLQTMYDSGEMNIGLDVWINPLAKNLPLIEEGPRLNGELTVSAIKLYADGALGSRGACLLEPYSDAPTSGMIVESPDFFRKWCQIAVDNNLQVATHCIGDSANRLMLDIYSEFLEESNDNRWRIEHAQVVHPVDVGKYGKYNIVPSVQPTHCTSDMYWAAERLGDRIENAYVFQSLLQQNGWLPAGSDFPVEQINPLYGFYAAVSRKDHKGWPEKGFQSDEVLTREQALRAMTIWAAKSNFTENRTGSLEVGKEADFVVLDTDLMHAHEQEVFSARVLSAYKGGSAVFVR